MDRNLSRFSKYRVMWLQVFFDLPTETKKTGRHTPNSRKDSSTTDSPCSSSASMSDTAPAARTWLYTPGAYAPYYPPYGKVGILGITDKQFGNMEVYYGQKATPPNPVSFQLELF